MTATTIKRVYIFKGFERFWHWAQAALIIAMAVTGFEVHGTYSLLGFETAVVWHSYFAWSLIGLWVFAIFWHLTTGEWRHYIPTTEKLMDVAMFYAMGIFKGEHHPYKPTVKRKHNPLQLLAYLGVKLFMIPLLWVSGLLYLFYNELGLSSADLGIIALLHTAGAFFIIIFLVAHVYLITTGHTVGAHLKAMITGYDEQEED